VTGTGGEAGCPHVNEHEFVFVHQLTSIAIQSTPVGVLLVRRTERVKLYLVTASAPTLISASAGVSADTTSVGDVVSRACGKVTVFVLNAEPEGTVTVSPLPTAILGMPDIVPSVLNVSGPQCPDPSPLISNLSFVDFNTAGSAFGNELLAGGWKYARPVGSGVEVTFSATFARAQLGLDGPR